MSYRFGIFGSFGGKSGIKLVETILAQVQSKEIEAEIPFVFSSRAIDEEGNAARLRELVTPETDLIIHSARRSRPWLFKQDRARWRELYHREVMSLISGYTFDSIVLIGYMFFVSDELCQRYNLLNLHPAPPGGPKGSWQEVIWQLIAENASQAGVQIHLATSEWDAGPTLSYCTTPIDQGEFKPLWEDMYQKLRKHSLAEIKQAEYMTNPLACKIREAEAKLELPLLLETLRSLANGTFKIDGLGKSARIIAFGEERTTGYPLTDLIAGAAEKEEKRIIGSVKELIITKPPANEEAGEGLFLFTDNYSIFDWGTMPDQLPEKGKVLALMSAYNFELLERAGITTHYRGLVTEEGIVSYNQAHNLLSQRQAKMAIKVVSKPPLVWTGTEYDYHRYLYAAGRNYLIPLEIVYRFSVPVGASLRMRYDPRDLGLNYSRWPNENVVLPQPKVELFTKLEGRDRFVDRAEALRISGLDESSLAQMEEITLAAGRLLALQAEAQGLTIADGKLEFASCNGRLIVCDLLGTPDENRFHFNGFPVSKELLRQYYIQHDPLWVKEVKQTKNTWGNRPNWQQHSLRMPAPLPSSLRELYAEIYCAVANRYLGRQWFSTRSLERLLAAVKEEESR
ncbi:hypothetical protein LM599_01840 [Candidatus Acetothermia bacterium]|jgi:phosphoribosylaminoimidazole-succinocarboxamide synthase|nr:hypothetical protein [Candidatus Acetothermia bacterium]MCI2427827.1 hypothetical protein [Candidatus Acetothermia bacterium]